MRLTAGKVRQHGALAQLAARLIWDQEATGSNPACSTTGKPEHNFSPFFDGKETNHVRFDLRQSISTQAAYQTFWNGSRKLFVNLTSAAGSDSLVHKWIPIVKTNHSPIKGGNLMAQEYEAPNKRQKQLIKKRGLNPENYVVLRELNYALFLIDKRFKTIKVIDKRS